MNGMVVVVVGAEFCTWGWVWVESEGGGRVVVVVRLVWESGVREGWMSGMECMEINCFLGDDVLMAR